MTKRSTPKKYIRMRKSVSCHGGFVLLSKEIYPVLYEGQSLPDKYQNRETIYIIESNVVKNKFRLPIAVYARECDEVTAEINNT